MFLREHIDDCVVCNNTLIALLMTPKNLLYNAIVFRVFNNRSPEDLGN